MPISERPEPRPQSPNTRQSETPREASGRGEKGKGKESRTYEPPTLLAAKCFGGGGGTV